MACTEQANLDWRNSWRSYCNNNYISTGYIVNGGSYTWNNLRVENLGTVQHSGYYWIRIRITWPWGFVETVDWWECWGQWRSISSTQSSSVYDGRYNYVNYSHGLYLFCDGATTLSDGRIQLEIGYNLAWQYTWLIDIDNGNDSWGGLNWAYPKKTLTAGAQSVQNNASLWIASGDYTTAPGTAAVISPANLAGGGQIQYVIKDPHLTGVFEFSCGERLASYIGNIARSAWGQIRKYYHTSTADYNWARGFESSLTSLVSSDKMITAGKAMQILINSNTEHTIFTGSTLILDEPGSGHTYRLEFVELNSSYILRLDLKKDGALVDQQFLEEGDTYQYWEYVLSEDIPIINVYIKTLFRGTETNSATIQGIFQLSSYIITL